MVKLTETSRTEAFSDAVFAIAITILVLTIPAPHTNEIPAGSDLMKVVFQHWPAYASYILSFITILIMWVNHHNMFTYIKSVDHNFMILNGVLLMFITIIPIPTAILAEHILTKDQKSATLIYSGIALIISILYNIVWYYAAYKKRLLDKDFDSGMLRKINKILITGPVAYAVTFILAFFNVWLCLGIYIGLLLFFGYPHKYLKSEKDD